MNASLHYLLHSGKNSKAAYYIGAAWRDLVPDSITRHQLKREMDTCARLYDEAYIADRVDYYCKLDSPAPLGAEASRIGQLGKQGNPSTYYYDSRELLQWFPADRMWNFKFGDVRDIPPHPAIVKSRNLGDNSNAVLLKLDKCRHFVYVKDRTPFEQKKDRAIFRGQVGTRENRILFINKFAGNARIDAANTLANGGLLANNANGEKIVPRLSLYDHLQYRYIMALEGNDVASNLKWVMSSRSLAVTPRPTCETWFMEGRLLPGIHYVEVKDDFSDLEAQMDYYSSHPAEANDIADNANRYVAQFRDKRRERYIGLRVLQKYFNLTNPD